MRPPQESRVEAVIAATVALCRDIPNVVVFDGPVNNETAERDGIAVGVGDEAAIVTQARTPGLGNGSRETVNVVCSAWSWSGTVDYQPRRTRVVEILSQLRDRIGADPTLGGACDRASIGSDQSWVQDSADEGIAVSVGFSVEAQTFI